MGEDKGYSKEACVETSVTHPIDHSPIYLPTDLPTVSIGCSLCRKHSMILGQARSTTSPAAFTGRHCSRSESTAVGADAVSAAAVAAIADDEIL